MQLSPSKRKFQISCELTLFCVAQKGISANLLKVGSKRRRRKTDKVEDQEEMSVREKIQEEVERQTKNLKNQLAQKEAEVQNNQNAASILSQFIS